MQESIVFLVRVQYRRKEIKFTFAISSPDEFLVLRLRRRRRLLLLLLLLLLVLLLILLYIRLRFSGCSYDAIRDSPRWRPTSSLDFRSADHHHRQLWRHWYGQVACSDAEVSVQLPVATTRRSSASHHSRLRRRLSPHCGAYRCRRRRPQKPEPEVRRERPRRKWNWRRAADGWRYRQQYVRGRGGNATTTAAITAALRRGNAGRRWRQFLRWPHLLRRELQRMQWRHTGKQWVRSTSAKTKGFD